MGISGPVTSSLNAEARLYYDGRIYLKVTDSNWQTRPGAVYIDSKIDYWTRWVDTWVPGAVWARTRFFQGQNVGTHLNYSSTSSSSLFWANTVVDFAQPTDNWGSQAASSYTGQLTTRNLNAGPTITVSFTGDGLMTVTMSGQWTGNIMGFTFQER
jgi:hypothetical protein